MNSNQSLESVYLQTLTSIGFRDRRWAQLYAVKIFLCTCISFLPIAIAMRIISHIDTSSVACDVFTRQVHEDFRCSSSPSSLERMITNLSLPSRQRRKKKDVNHACNNPSIAKVPRPPLSPTPGYLPSQIIIRVLFSCHGTS